MPSCAQNGGEHGALLEMTNSSTSLYIKIAQKFVIKMRVSKSQKNRKSGKILIFPKIKIRNRHQARFSFLKFLIISM